MEEMDRILIALKHLTGGTRNKLTGDQSKKEFNPAYTYSTVVIDILQLFCSRANFLLQSGYGSFSAFKWNPLQS